jgi:hypothetical protein
LELNTCNKSGSESKSDTESELVTKHKHNLEIKRTTHTPNKKTLHINNLKANYNHSISNTRLNVIPPLWNIVYCIQNYTVLYHKLQSKSKCIYYCRHTPSKQLMNVTIHLMRKKSNHSNMVIHKSNQSDDGERTDDSAISYTLLNNSNDTNNSTIQQNADKHVNSRDKDDAIVQYIHIIQSLHMDTYNIHTVDNNKSDKGRRCTIFYTKSISARTHTNAYTPSNKNHFESLQGWNILHDMYRITAVEHVVGVLVFNRFGTCHLHGYELQN